MQDFHHAKKSMKKAIKNYEEGSDKSKEDKKVIEYVLAMSYKNLGKFNKAAQVYNSLNKNFS